MLRKSILNLFIGYRINVGNNIIEVFGLTKYQDKTTESLDNEEGWFDLPKFMATIINRVL